MSNKVVIYHAHCSDGLGAAWVFHHIMPDAIFHAAVHGTQPPELTDKDVYMLDFAYPRNIMLDIKKKARSLLVLDHHKSTQEVLGDLEFCYFDMNRSGMGIAWDYVFPKMPRHWLVDYTEDKDIWKWKMPNSREINCVIQSYPLTFDSLYLLEKLNPSDLLAEGVAILRAQQRLVADIVSKAKEIEIHGYKVLAANTSVLQSEVAGYLARQTVFGVAWFETENGEKVYSLRSKPENNVDVSLIASKYPGGGGHKLSAAFRLKVGEKI